MRTRRLRGIDGIEGLALMAVVVHDLAPASMTGGFAGFDVLFTIAGFLVTRSLLDRHASDGRIDVRTYLLKRLRRLWPALALLVAGTGSMGALVALIGGRRAALAGIRTDVPAGLLFVHNWFGVAWGGGYLPAENARLLGHLWAVAVLAQCCLAAPFIVLALKRFLPRPRAIAALLGLAVVSALLMGVLYTSDSAAARVLYGTDTHCFGFLTGMALAWALRRGRSAGGADGVPEGIGDAGEGHVSKGIAADWRLVRDTALPWVSCAALVGLTVLAFRLRPDATAFHGGLALAALLTVPLLFGVLDERSWMLDLLEWRPLAMIGKYGYGIYLWHWPVWLIARDAAAVLGLPGGGWIPVCVTLLLTAVMAGISYRLVQKPFTPPVPEWPLGRAGTIVCGAAAVLLVAGLIAALVMA